MLLYTNGFLDDVERDQHFHDHGADFGATSPEEYEEMADDFLGGDCPPWIDQCWRRNGDLLRFDPEREWFGVLAPGNVILTFYIPDPSEHGCATNREYFEEQCRR